MPGVASSTVMVHPNYVEPGILLPYSQASGAFDTLYDGEPQVRLSDGDLYVYMKRIEVRTQAAAGQSAYNQLPSISTALSMISTPTYLLRIRGEYDHHDTAAYGRWGVNIADMQRLGMRQGIFQFMRNALLYGINPAMGEGLVNTAGATAVSLPADSFGNTTVVTYDPGQLATFLLTQLASIKTRTNNLGIGRKFVFLGPQRVFATMEYQGIVQLTSYQRPGAGTATIAGMVKNIAGENDDEILWCYDDTLIGKGAGGTDAVLIVMPEIKKINGGKVNTNEFAKLAPGIEACTLMYCDKAAPTEIPTPLPGGGIDTVAEMRITSGWGIRPETISILSMQAE